MQYDSSWNNKKFLFNHNIDIIREIVYAVSPYDEKEKAYNTWHRRACAKKLEALGHKLIPGVNLFTVEQRPYCFAIAVLDGDLYIDPDGSCKMIERDIRAPGRGYFNFINTSTGVHERIADLGDWFSKQQKDLSDVKNCGRFMKGPNWPVEDIEFQQGQHVSRGKKGEVGSVIRRHAHMAEVAWWRQDRPQNQTGWSYIYFNEWNGSVCHVEHKSYNTRFSPESGYIYPIQRKTYNHMPWHISELNPIWCNNTRKYLF